MDLKPETKRSDTKVPFFTSFFRWNASAFLATAADFFCLIFSTEVLGVYYLISVVIGAVVGAVVAFILGRYWGFSSRMRSIRHQSLRYLLVVIGSILLNTGGTWFFTDVIEFSHYAISRVLTSLSVGFFFNFPLQRYFVFQK